MSDKIIRKQHQATFDGIRHLDEAANEYWRARQLAKVLEYSEYRHFLPVVERAKTACQTSGQRVADHFEGILEMVEIGSGAQREVDDVRLSRYACYLIVQNGDSAKPVIANGQTYFALQTRRQELADDAKFAQLSEDEKRLAIRNELATHNKQLAAAAKDAGVETSLDLAIITDKPLPLSVSAALADDFSESNLPWKVGIVDWAATSESFRKVIEQNKVIVQKPMPPTNTA
ncbi:MAG: DNA damage-inducible protein D, partial [Candidatus Accumulibacter sp.]|nr:DNA damage-inducible protein D [Accumulibacter sp.]